MGPSVEQLQRQLTQMLRHGTGIAELIVATPTFVDLVQPAEPGMPRQELADRAIQAHRLLTSAVSALDQPGAEALGIMLCLWPGTAGLSLDQRRARAARLFGVQPDTFRRTAYEGHLTLKLAVELYKRVRDRHERRRTLPMDEQDGAA